MFKGDDGDGNGHVLEGGHGHCNTLSSADSSIVFNVSAFWTTNKNNQ